MLMSDKFGQHPAHKIDLVLIDRVAHIRVDALSHVTAEPAQRRRRLMHALQRDMEIDIAATEENRCALQRTIVLERGSGRADQPAAEANQPTVTPGMASRIFQRQTGPLRKTKQHSLFSRDTSLLYLPQHIPDRKSTR